MNNTVFFGEPYRETPQEQQGVFCHSSHGPSRIGMATKRVLLPWQKHGLRHPRPVTQNIIYTTSPCKTNRADLHTRAIKSGEQKKQKSEERGKEGPLAKARW